MTLSGLVWANLRRNKKRTVLTMLSVVVAFFLFGTLRSVITTLDKASEVGSEGRLIVSSASGITFLLPQAHANRLQSVDGVKSVAWANWFGGYYQNPNDFFAQFAIKADTYLPMYPEIAITAGSVDEFMRERTGAIIGAGLIKKYGWQLGQKVTLKGTFMPGDWEFNIRAVYTPSDPAFGDEIMLFHYEYLYERTGGEITPGWFVLELNRPDRAGDIAAGIDAQFKNSVGPTKTQTERAWNAGFVTMWGNIGFLVGAIGTAVFFAILFVAANTMMMAVRERIGEIAVLKTLGFGNGTVFGLVLAESVLITVLGGFLGLLLARTAFLGRNALSAFFPGFGVTGGTIILGLVMALALGLVSGAVPAIQSARLSVVSALRRVA
ncbi:MAG: FtsX-like permease family protein [Gemmatimonadales bacterium]|nr:FtsX-like permease family protein [Gemmatimonadales bacterium]